MEEDQPRRRRALRAPGETKAIPEPKEEEESPPKRRSAPKGSDLEITPGAEDDVSSIFVNTNKGPGLTRDFEAVIETVYTIEVRKDYEDLEKSLMIGEQRGDYGTLLRALDEAETKARRAHRLWLGSKLEQKNWELDAEVVDAQMRHKAVQDLEGEKALGERKKMITEADVSGKIHELFPEEYRARARTRLKIEGTVKHMERLAELWLIRCRTLATMIATIRK